MAPHSDIRYPVMSERMQVIIAFVAVYILIRALVSEFDEGPVLSWLAGLLGAGLFVSVGHRWLTGRWWWQPTPKH